MTMSFDVIIPFLRPIKHLLESETVSEIMVNPDSSVWIEEDGAIQLLPGIHFDDEALIAALEVVANKSGKKLIPTCRMQLAPALSISPSRPPVCSMLIPEMLSVFRWASRARRREGRWAECPTSSRRSLSLLAAVIFSSARTACSIASEASLQ
jgi:pilus assembly protein CpaF